MTAPTDTATGVWLVASKALGRPVDALELPPPCICGTVAAGRRGHPVKITRSMCTAHQ